MNDTPAPRRRLGGSAVQVGPLGLGTAPLAGLNEPVGDADARAALLTALDRGIDFFDTAPHYGVGLAEERIGAALAARPSAAPVLATKVGRRLRPLPEGAPDDAHGFIGTPRRERYWDWSRDGIRACVEESLRRLGRDRVDVVLLHDPDDFEDEVYATAYPALAELREQGVVGAIGAGMNQTAMLTRFVRRLDLDVVLCAGRYTLLEQGAADDLFPACRERGTSVVLGGVYNSGILARPEPGAHYNYAPAEPAVLARAEALGRVCAAHGVPLRAAALRFAGADPVVASVLVGCRAGAEVHDNADMAALPIPDALWSDLRAQGLIRPDAAVPPPRPATGAGGAP
ncbi:aldo/keto reductase [Allonocardiopsis opalescens]|uniref:D-threo-aldose 1-dehydrogenase n=1 Tax=Allonocardiopsis opalescens TaxID=1144618 RepID=A0A2T0PXM1_9ACTN|nr:aldo/keto reductase [Allonocardiopsis opalescens]PRX96269.1 D-threo-aldose 1-dehydrogenase [Allonocardiopsis opalescens]